MLLGAAWSELGAEFWWDNIPLSKEVAGVQHTSLSLLSKNMLFIFAISVHIQKYAEIEKKFT